MVYALVMETNQAPGAEASDVETLGGREVYESPYKTVEEWLAALEGDDLAEAKDLLGIEGELNEQTRWPREVPVGEFAAGVAPLFGAQGTTGDAKATQTRVRATLEALRPADVELLTRRFVERMTLQEIAEEDGVTKQTIHEKLEVASRRFQQAYGVV